jgi:hypothetical protein
LDDQGRKHLTHAKLCAIYGHKKDEINAITDPVERENAITHFVEYIDARYYMGISIWPKIFFKKNAHLLEVIGFEGNKKTAESE